VTKAFEDAGEPPAEAVQVVGGSGIVVNTKPLSAAESQDLQKQVAKTLGINQNKVSVTSIGSQWGHDTTIRALEGLIIFLIAVSIYISLRFQWRMAVGGMLALLHDLVVAAGIYSIVGFEVTPSTIVGLLTILGFSLYDTVVVYDKVGENAKDILAGSRTTYSEAANLAVNQTLMRSINTSLIALLPVAGLLFVGAGILGVGTIKDLALILFVGLASGAYSSLFLATPIVVDLTERDPQYKALTKRVTAKRASEAKRASDAELAGVAAAPARRTGPAPAPRVGARPERRRRK
jgi:preprotein translocase subunit SecF